MNQGKNGPDEPKSRLKISITGDDYNTNDFLFCWDRFGSRPNRTTVHCVYSTRLFNVVMSKHVQDRNILADVIPEGDNLIVNEKILAHIDDSCYLSYIVADRDSEDSFIETVTFYHKDGYGHLETLIEELAECTMSSEEGESADTGHARLNTLAIGHEGLEIEPVHCAEVDPDIASYYSAETFKLIGKAAKKIRKSNSGLTILHGERGTGKTSAVKYISTKVDRQMLFIPNNMIEHTINNPDFRRFLKRMEMPILVIDDCEMMLNEMFTKSNLFSNNLLQLIDGFLSDTINANVIAIFNVEREDDIDHSLLECNNLLEVVEFTRLDEKESNELAKLVDSSKKYKGKNRMADVVKKRETRHDAEMGF